MKNRDLQDIVSDLVGPIYPSADSAIDATRRENLKEYIELFKIMFMNIHNVVAWNQAMNTRTLWKLRSVRLVKLLKRGRHYNNLQERNKYHYHGRDRIKQDSRVRLE